MIDVHLQKVNALQELFKNSYKYMIMIDKFYYNLSKSNLVRFLISRNKDQDYEI